MDKGTPYAQRFVIERLGRGCVINAHAFLVEDVIDFNITCVKKSVIYSLSARNFARISKEFEAFDKNIQKIIVENFTDTDNKIALDYTFGLTEPKFLTYEQNKRYRESDRKATKIALLKLKNAIYFLLVQRRVFSSLRTTSLKKILEEAIDHRRFIKRHMGQHALNFAL